MKLLPLFFCSISLFFLYGCLTKNTINQPNPITINSGQGYLCQYTIPSGDTIKSFQTTWTVPSTPLRDSTIFWWNALDGGPFLQPVLQWENGNWTIANWYSLNGNFFHGKFIPVTPGTSLTGVIELISHTKTSYTYKESFVGYPDADVTATFPEMATMLEEDMEAYTNTITAFPPDQYIEMTNIFYMTTDGRKVPVTNWTIIKDGAISTPSGKNTVIQSDGFGSSNVFFYFK